MIKNSINPRMKFLLSKFFVKLIIKQTFKLKRMFKNSNQSYKNTYEKKSWLNKKLNTKQ